MATQQLTFDLTSTTHPPVAPSCSKAAAFVEAGLTDCRPPGTPLMGEILHAKFIGKGEAVATLMMFDGQQGTVEVSKWTSQFPGAWCISWKDTGNKPCHWNGTAWERIDLEI